MSTALAVKIKLQLVHDLKLKCKALSAALMCGARWLQVWHGANRNKHCRLMAEQSTVVAYWAHRHTPW